MSLIIEIRKMLRNILIESSINSEFNSFGEFELKNGYLFSSNKKIGVLELSKIYSDVIELNKILIFPEHRGMGLANKIMGQLTKMADDKNYIIVLTPTSDFGSRLNKLKTWYVGHGFIFNKGKNKDFRFRALMYREPE